MSHGEYYSLEQAYDNASFLINTNCEEDRRILPFPNQDLLDAAARYLLWYRRGDHKADRERWVTGPQFQYERHWFPERRFDIASGQPYTKLIEGASPWPIQINRQRLISNLMAIDLDFENRQRPEMNLLDNFHRRSALWPVLKGHTGFPATWFRDVEGDTDDEEDDEVVCLHKSTQCIATDLF
jgi:hypothetical protein